MFLPPFVWMVVSTGSVVVGVAGRRALRIVAMARSATAAAEAIVSGTPHSFAAPAWRRDRAKAVVADGQGE